MRKIWIVKTAEPLPCDEGVRLLRMGLVAQALSKDKANELVWWSSTFDHYRKRVRCEQDKIVNIEENYIVRLMHITGNYTSNLSPKRLLHQLYEGKRFYQLAVKEDKPDVIVCPMPTLEMAYYASMYAKRFSVPLIIDIRDLFPDMYIDFVPAKYRFIVKLGVIPYRIMLRKALKNATSLIATSEKFLEWGLRYSKRTRMLEDRVFYVSYPDNNLVLNQKEIDYWYDNFDLKKEDFICCFFGKFGFTVDLETVMRAAVITQIECPSIKYVICGEGEKLNEYKEILGDAQNVIFPGWVNRRQICALGRISKVGLLAYKPGKNYEDSMPNKFCEYLALGQVLLVEPKGMMLDFATKFDCGMSFTDEITLSKCLVDLQNNKDKVEKMRHNSRNLYEELFCAEKVYDEYASFICDCVDKNM